MIYLVQASMFSYVIQCIRILPKSNIKTTDLPRSDFSCYFLRRYFNCLALKTESLQLYFELNTIGLPSDFLTGRSLAYKFHFVEPREIS